MCIYVGKKKEEENQTVLPLVYSSTNKATNVGVKEPFLVALRKGKTLSRKSKKNPEICVPLTSSEPFIQSLKETFKLLIPSAIHWLSLHQFRIRACVIRFSTCSLLRGTVPACFWPRWHCIMFRSIP